MCYCFHTEFPLCFQTQQEKAEREKEQKQQKERDRKKKERQMVAEGKKPYFLKKC